MFHKLCLFVLILFNINWVYPQCPNDICLEAIQVEQQTPESFCNYDCSVDFEFPWETNWNFNEYPCQYPNYDLWYFIDVQIGGMVEFYVESDYVNEDSTTIGNFGPLEGITMDIWGGDDCFNIDFVWGTQCYWFTNETYCCILEYDPTRQSWHFVIDLTPGIYYINIDGWGYSVGCGEWWWSEPYFLGLTIEETYGQEKIEFIKKYTGQNYNILGQLIR